MIGTIYITGEIGVDITLIDVIKQVKAQPSALDYLVKIDSIGGYVDAGNDIFNYLKNLDKPVTTHAIQAYSIASVIFMAGSKRIISEGNDKAIMIHLPWMEVAGSHDVITSYLSNLKATEDQLVKFYSEALEIDKDTIQSLLSNETYLSATQAKELGFATMIQPMQKAVARLYNNNENKEEKSLMNKLQKEVTAIYNKVFGIKNEMILQDATATELLFPDLAEGEIAEVGAKATTDGKPAEGEFLMPDGSKLMFEAGVLNEIIPAEVLEDTTEPVDIEDDEVSADIDVRIAELEAENEALKAKIAELEGQQANVEAKEDEQTEKMVAILAKAIERSDELEVKYQALAKQIGSDFQPDTKKENNPAVKAQGENKPVFSFKRK